VFPRALSRDGVAGSTSSGPDAGNAHGGVGRAEKGTSLIIAYPAYKNQ